MTDQAAPDAETPKTTPEQEQKVKESVERMQTWPGKLGHAIGATLKQTTTLPGTSNSFTDRICNWIESTFPPELFLALSRGFAKVGQVSLAVAAIIGIVYALAAAIRVRSYAALLMGLGIGLSVNNSFAVVEALANKESEFIRTPKFGIENKKDSWITKKYKGDKSVLIPVIELILGFYFTVTVIISIIEGIWLTLPFLILFQYGYLYISFLSFSTILKNRLLIKKTTVGVIQ